MDKGHIFLLNSEKMKEMGFIDENDELALEVIYTVMKSNKFYKAGNKWILFYNYSSGFASWLPELTDIELKPSKKEFFEMFESGVAHYDNITIHYDGDFSYSGGSIRVAKFEKSTGKLDKKRREYIERVHKLWFYPEEFNLEYFTGQIWFYNNELATTRFIPKDNYISIQSTTKIDNETISRVLKEFGLVKPNDKVTEMKPKRKRHSLY